MTEQSTQLGDADQRTATRTAQALAAHWQAVADEQRATIERLTKEVARARDTLAGMVDQYMTFREGYISHEFMSAQEETIDYLEDIGWITGGALERYYWTPASGRKHPDGAV